MGSGLKEANNALSSQVGGAHYKQYKVQPVEYAMANNLNYCQANVVKYTTRYKDKNGVEDLIKAAHCIQQLLEIEYGKEASERLSISFS